MQNCQIEITQNIPNSRNFGTVFSFSNETCCLTQFNYVRLFDPFSFCDEVIIMISPYGTAVPLNWLAAIIRTASIVGSWLGSVKSDIEWRNTQWTAEQEGGQGDSV